MFRILSATLLAALVSTGFADIAVIEGFEDTNDLGNWQASTTALHTQNASVSGGVPVYVSADVTEGSLAGQFNATWTIPGVAAASNPYVTTGPLTYWAVRYNINAPTSLPNNSIATANGILQADIKNNNAYPVNVALVVDSAASSQLERGPLLSVAANSTLVYTWDFAVVAPVGFDTGNGVFSGDEQRVKSLLVYSELEPTAGTSNIVVDNIRNVNSADLTPPAAPQIRALQQGATTGQAVVKWAASLDSDVAAYRIYVSNDANFGTPNVNRLAFPPTPVMTVSAGQQSAIISSLPTGQNVYVAVTAVDNAPTANESEMSQALGVNLRADGLPPQDRIVLDNDHYTPASASFVTQGYFHAVVYTAQALHGLGRSFDSITDEALAESLAVLTPNDAAVVVWSNLEDGTGATGDSLSADSLARISTFVAGGGNIIVSGSAVAEDIAVRPGGTTTLANTLKASLQSGNVAVPLVVPSGPLQTAAGFSTAQNATINAVAYATSANDGLLPTNGSVELATYSGVPALSAVAGVGYQQSLVFLGFAFETAGDPAGVAASATVRQGLMQSMINFLTGVTAASDWQLFD